MSFVNVIDKMASIPNVLIFQDRELQELRHIINNLKEKNEMGDQSKVGSGKSITKCPKLFFAATATTRSYFNHKPNVLTM